MHEQDNYIVKRLKSAIEMSGLSYTELEKKTGIAKSSIQRYASGLTKKIPIDAVNAIGNATGVSFAWIMGWEKTPHQNSTEIVLSNHEKKLVIAYREKLNMQSAVDTLLGISSNDADNSTKNVYPIKKTAHNDSQKAAIADSKDNFVEIPYVARSGERGTVTKTQEELDSILPLLETLEAKSDPDL